MKKTYEATILREGSMCCVPVPFDPKPVFGRVRAPVKVTLNGYTYRSTIAAMGGGCFVPLRRSHREAAGLLGGETLKVTLELDVEKREVAPPTDLVKALKTDGAWERWQELSYTHRREHVEAIEQAMRAETRARRVAAAVRTVSRPRLNARWHQSHPMPKNPTLEQRIAWHRAHRKQCGCRPVPASLRQALG